MSLKELYKSVISETKHQRQERCFLAKLCKKSCLTGRFPIPLINCLKRLTNFIKRKTETALGDPKLNRQFLQNHSTKQADKPQNS